MLQRRKCERHDEKVRRFNTCETPVLAPACLVAVQFPVERAYSRPDEIDLSSSLMFSLLFFCSRVCLFFVVQFWFIQVSDQYDSEAEVEVAVLPSWKSPSFSS